jgi:hypothetical protein
MSQIVTYQNDARGCFCQLRLASGERVFISIAQTGLRISRMRLGLIPTTRLLDLPSSNPLSAETFGRVFWQADPSDAELEEVAQVSMLDCVVAALRPCGNLAEVRQRLLPQW